MQTNHQKTNSEDLVVAWCFYSACYVLYEFMCEENIHREHTSCGRSIPQEF